MPFIAIQPARQVSSRAASISVAMSASLKAIASCLAIGLPNAIALQRVVAREFERGARDAERSGGDHGPGRLEHDHRPDGSGSGRLAVLVVAETLLLGNEAVLEDDLRGVRRAHAELALLAPLAHARAFPSR